MYPMKKLTTILTLLLLIAISMQAQKTYVLLTGVSNYGVDSINLFNTTKDVKQLKEKVCDKKGFTTAILTSRYANHQNIVTKLNAIVKLAKSQDRIIFFFSGHGTYGGFVPHDRSLFNYQELLNILSKAKAARIYCFIDACMSGSIKSISANNFGIGDNNPRICVMTASDATELSMEDSWVGHGYFTKALLKGLQGIGASDKDKDKRITLEELFDYVSQDVVFRTRNAKQVQHPQLIPSPSLLSSSVLDEVLIEW